MNLFGGGTLYPWYLRWENYVRRPLNFAIGMGVADPMPRKKFGLLTRLAMWRCRFAYLGVRGPRSAAILAAHGIDSIVTGDTALFQRLNEPATLGSDSIGVSFIGEEMQRSGNPLRVFSVIRDLCERLNSEGLRIKLIPFCRKDIPAAHEMVDELQGRGEVIDFWGNEISESLPAFLGTLSSCRAIVAERLHAAVLAAAVGVPFVSIAYKSKCADFIESLDFDKTLIFHPEQLHPGVLFHALVALLNDREHAGRMAAAVVRLRNRLSVAATEISARIAEARARGMLSPASR